MLNAVKSACGRRLDWLSGKKTNIMLLITCVIFFGAINTAFAGDDDKVTATVSDLPSEMTPGSSVQITVTITNTGYSTWSSDKLSVKVIGWIDFNEDLIDSFNLEPGQSVTFRYTLTAPNKNCSIKCEINFYSSGNKFGSKRKIINFR